jgi:hypothetical protein
MATLDPRQREHELSEALTSFLIAVSRYGGNNTRPRLTAKRLDSLQHITVLVAHAIAERVHNISGKKAAAGFRKALGRRRKP